MTCRQDRRCGGAGGDRAAQPLVRSPSADKEFRGRRFRAGTWGLTAGGATRPTIPVRVDGGSPPVEAAQGHVRVMGRFDAARPCPPQWRERGSRRSSPSTLRDRQDVGVFISAYLTYTRVISIMPL